MQRKRKRKSNCTELQLREQKKKKKEEIKANYDEKGKVRNEVQAVGAITIIMEITQRETK